MFHKMYENLKKNIGFGGSGHPSWSRLDTKVADKEGEDSKTGGRKGKFESQSRKVLLMNCRIYGNQRESAEISRNQRKSHETQTGSEAKSI